MKKYNNQFIIGIDHGYGNMKTANTCFPTGVTAYDKEPIFKDNLLTWNGKYYLIGAEHKEFSADRPDIGIGTRVHSEDRDTRTEICRWSASAAGGHPLQWRRHHTRAFARRDGRSVSGTPTGATAPKRENGIAKAAPLMKKYINLV